MENTLGTIFAIFLSIFVFFGFPLIYIADKKDDIAQSALQSETASFVDDVRKTGVLSDEKISNYESKIQSLTGTIMEINYEIKLLDENYAKKSSSSTSETSGEARYYSIYNTQIKERLDNYRIDIDLEDNENGIIYLKQGDIFCVTAGNVSETMADSFKRFLYKIAGNRKNTLYTEASGKVLVYGKW